MSLKVMTIVGTRPEIVKLSRVINALDLNFTHLLVHTGQNYDYELNDVFFEDLDIRKPDHFLNAVGDSVAETIGNIIFKIDNLLEKEKPDAVLIYGDTNSCLSVISAKKRKIPIFHMEAGNRCFDLRVPEEINRKIVDHISDINLPLTEHAKQYLIMEGIRPETIIKTGSCMKEVIDYYSKKIESSLVLDNFSIKKNDYFVLSLHREENIDYKKNFDNLLESIEEISKFYNKKIIFSAHPRTRKKLKEIDYHFNKNVIITKPLGFIDYIYLQKNAFCVISDSGTITEESNILNFPAIMVRQSHERPEGMDDGVLIMSGLKAQEMINSIEITRRQFENVKNYKVYDYHKDIVSKKIVNIIQSYTNYINRVNWKKYD